VTNAAGVSEWVMMSALWDSITRELGMPRAQAKALLRPHFIGLIIKTRVPAMSAYIADAFEKEGLLRIMRNGPSPLVTEGGWADMGAYWSAGKLRGWDIEVCWADVAQLLGDIDGQPERAQAQPSSLAAGRKRKPAGVNYAAADCPLIEEMHSLITSGQAKGPYDAALAVVDRAKGSPNSESKAKRLVRRYSAAFSSEHDRQD